jgi:hypothetical protein
MVYLQQIPQVRHLQRQDTTAMIPIATKRTMMRIIHQVNLQTPSSPQAWAPLQWYPVFADALLAGFAASKP